MMSSPNLFSAEAKAGKAVGVFSIWWWFLEGCGRFGEGFWGRFEVWGVLEGLEKGGFGRFFREWSLLGLNIYKRPPQQH